MNQHQQLDDEKLRAMIRHKQLNFGGNRKLKIYGSLNCASGKRMKKANRVFFTDESEAIQNGYRPCGNCMWAAYKQWKHGTI